MSVMVICVLQDRKLRSACRDGNLSRVQRLVKQGSNVNSKGRVSVEFIMCTFCLYTCIVYSSTTLYIVCKLN